MRIGASHRSTTSSSSRARAVPRRSISKRAISSTCVSPKRPMRRACSSAISIVAAFSRRCSERWNCSSRTNARESAALRSINFEAIPPCSHRASWRSKVASGSRLWASCRGCVTSVSMKKTASHSTMRRAFRSVPGVALRATVSARYVSPSSHFRFSPTRPILPPLPPNRASTSRTPSGRAISRTRTS